MKRRTTVLLLAFVAGIASASEQIVIQQAAGDVSVRQGVTEVWNKVAAGDVLRPNDTMRTGKGGNAVLMVTWASAPAARRIVLPPQVIVDMSDIRDLTPEELMLKLTMEKVRGSANQWKNDGIHLPNAAVVHGQDGSAAPPPRENDAVTGRLVMNGAQVLFDNGFFASCVLRAMEVFRLYPSMRGSFGHRLMLAEAMENATLRGEALAEYGAVSRMEGLSPEQQSQVQMKIRSLRK